MSNILLISSSPRGEHSLSAKVAADLAAGLAAKQAGSTIVTRDLVAAPLPHIDPDFSAGIFTPADKRTESQAAVVAISDAAIDEVLQADTIVIATAFINFSISSNLKAWIDHLARAGRTFSYDGNGFTGLVTNKKVYLVLAYGGVYSSGPMQAMDFCEPYLRTVLGFMGMSDVETIRIEGVNMGGEGVEKAVAAAQQKARELTLAA